MELSATVTFLSENSMALMTEYSPPNVTAVHGPTWSMDFMADQRTDGRLVWMLNERAAGHLTWF